MNTTLSTVSIWLGTALVSLSLAQSPVTVASKGNKSTASNENKFEVDLGIGLGATWRNSDNLLKGVGPTFSIHPKYKVSSNVNLGLNLQVAALSKFVSPVHANSGTPTSNTPLDAKGTAIWGASLTGDYTFSTKKYSPFIGLGLGVYGQGSATTTINNKSYDIPLGTNFGVSPYIGMNLNKIRLTGEVVLLNETGAMFNRDYFNIKASYTLGKK